MRILYFAQARTATGTAAEELATDAALAADALWTELLRRHPTLASLRPATRLARNGEFAPSDAIFHPADEVALIPPVSGG
jgi:molybdopterin converting factor subunit 1